MRAALTLGRRGLGRVWPNPSVGCVIVRDGVVIGRGRTGDGGRPHAETQALAQAGDASGATVYVTLEPCAHHGHTPPCAQALIDANVARVVIACQDTDTRVAGKGVAMLQNAGIDVSDADDLSRQMAQDDHAGFFQRLGDGTPLLTLKLAATIDGRIATSTGQSKWITGPQARRMVHAMRAQHDAVLVGGGTARADDPMLDVRGMGQVPQPVRIVVSKNLDIPQDGKLALSARQHPLWLCHASGADTAPWHALGAKTIACALDGDRVDLVDMMTKLGDAGLTRVFCEGGAMLAGQLLDRVTVHALISFTGGRLIGADGLASVGLRGITQMDAAPKLTLQETRRVGDDVMQRWQPAR